MQNRTQIRNTISETMDAFLESDWMEQEQNKRYIEWATYGAIYLLLSSINIGSAVVLSTFLPEDISTNIVLFGLIFFQLALTIFVIHKTPLRKLVIESCTRIKH